MPDEKPRPQYGEYATPEQQAKAMGREYVPQAAKPEAPAPPTPAPPQALQPQPLGVLLNRITTILFLAYGVIMLINDIPIYEDFAATVNKVLATAGNPLRITDPSNLTGVWGLVANIVLLLATAVLSFWQLRRGRLSFYIPVVGFAVFVAVLTVLAVTLGHLAAA
jgi:hypothetical protein